MYVYRNLFEVLCVIRFSNYCLTINTYIVLEFLATVHIVHEWSGSRFRAIIALDDDLSPRAPHINTITLHAYDGNLNRETYLAPDNTAVSFYSTPPAAVREIADLFPRDVVYTIYLCILK